MTAVLRTVTMLIHSSLGELAAGGVLAGIVRTFVERVEVLLNETGE
jgi:hypothetical protein